MTVIAFVPSMLASISIPSLMDSFLSAGQSLDAIGGWLVLWALILVFMFIWGMFH